VGGARAARSEKLAAAAAAGGGATPLLADSPPGCTQPPASAALARAASFAGLLAFPGSAQRGGAPAWVELRLRYPASARKLLMLNAAERAAGAAALRASAGLTRAIASEQKVPGLFDSARQCVLTEGCSLGAAWEACAWPGGEGAAIDANKIYTNDIAAVLRAYGVEAARSCIAREMRAVFQAYGINVDARHLSLVADYMTQGGRFKPMNRAGMDMHGSPLMKMSFETVGTFLNSALLRGETEDCTSPSARIALGRPVDAGTGAFDLWVPLGEASAPS